MASTSAGEFSGLASWGFFEADQAGKNRPLPPSDLDRKCDPRPSRARGDAARMRPPARFRQILTQKADGRRVAPCCARALRVARRLRRRASEQRDKLAPPSLTRLACCDARGAHINSVLTAK
jgi:hypothetical protein